MFTLNCNGRLLVTDKPIVMGIINATPDSFYADSRFTGEDATLACAEKMLKGGASILDIGGQSTRPGSLPISTEEELKRVIGPIQAISRNFPEAFISIDTYSSTVAKEAVNAGAGIVNDVSAGTLDKEMITTVAGLKVPYILMHMQGTPETMQAEPYYDDVVKEVLDFFIQKIDRLTRAGITDIVIDPGFGFGKTISHNFELLRNLSVFQVTGKPVLAGISRKSTIYKTLGITPEEALNGTTVLNTICLLNGASILRVHDVNEAVEAIKLYQAYKN
ncbi:MAG TPA: dihydropteroate synthase [Chitinophagaceae bacterium]|nr:dihydropteroate synthase [Chitinophagaceae bacterium]